MRDPELLLELLRAMAADEFGRMNLPTHLGMSKEEQNRVHHMEQLADAGHADWYLGSNGLPRITSAGYDFIAAVDKNPKIMDTFLEQLKKGIPYLQAAAAAMSLLG